MGRIAACLKKGALNPKRCRFAGKGVGWSFGFLTFAFLKVIGMLRKAIPFKKFKP